MKLITSPFLYTFANNKSKQQTHLKNTKKMNHFTSIEQSKKLLELGLKPETSDCMWEQHNGLEPYITVKPHTTLGRSISCHAIPCWSVGALLELMPKMFYIEGKDDLIEVALLLAKDQVIYEYTEYDDNYEVFRSKIGNFIDCLYETVCWLLQNNYIKTE